MKSQNKLLGNTLIIILLLAGCNVKPLQNISASDPKIGVDISEDGFLKAEVILIPSAARIIYFQFMLDAPEKMEVLLDFKWYQERNLYYAYSGAHVKGSVTATLERNPALLKKFSPGHYYVEVWFLNTLLTSKAFQVQE